MEIFALGILAAALQATGYLVYGFKVLRKEILPNPASWLMFAYGTSFLLILEWDRDASFALLALPAVCALLSVAIALYCLHKVRRAWWPEHGLEKFSFSLDVLLTIAYLFTWILLAQGAIGVADKDWADTFILVCWNLGIFTAFFPLLRQVYHRPQSEHVMPWIIWTCAYATLSVVTIVEQQGINELLAYPVINTAVHGFIAIRLGVYHWSRTQT